MATNAIETAKQENGSKLFFQSVIEQNKEPSSGEMKKVYEGYGAEWRDTYRKQTNALKKFLGGSRGYEYSRDRGIMPMIEDIAKKQCGVSVKDRWNPMDIVMVKKTQKRIVEEKIKQLTNVDGMSKEAKLNVLNMYMKEALKHKILIGVSLKAISKNKRTATVELANANGKASPVSLDLVPKSLKCNLTLGKKKNFLFDTGELGFDIVTTKGGQVHGQSRNFQYSKARNLVQTDLTPKGKDAGAKLGKVSSVALEKILKDLGLKRPESASKHRMIPPVGKWEKSQIDYWIDVYKKLKLSNMIDLGEVAVYENSQRIAEGIEEVMAYAINYETNEADRSSGGRFSSKLIAMEWAHIWVQIAKKKKMTEWCTALYYGAKKEFGSSNGPFLKIY